MIIDEAQRKQYLANGRYTWEVNQQWQAGLEYVWDISAREHNWYNVFLYPLGRARKINLLNRLHVTDIQNTDGLQTMLNAAELAIIGYMQRMDTYLQQVGCDE